MDGYVQHDGFGRDINYLRIAVTDKCNFRCIYCMPADGVAPRAHDELLSAEEIARFVRLVAGEGRKIQRGFVLCFGGKSLSSVFTQTRLFWPDCVIIRFLMLTYLSTLRVKTGFFLVRPEK